MVDDFNTTRCPKCGHQSQNSEICDVCGAVFAKVREREYAGESFQLAPTDEADPATGSLGRVIFLVTLFLVIAGGVVSGFWIWRSMNPQTIDDLILSHRNLAKKARQVIADEIETQKPSPEHKKLYLKALDLASAINKMGERNQSDGDWKIQIESLTEANSRLTELLGMSIEEFTATAAKMNYADPFAEVDEKLNIAQNPELGKRATNPLIQTLELLRGRAGHSAGR